MRNKHGQLFSLWIVIITLFLCGISISMYNTQQNKVAVSLVSPLAVLDVQDNLTIFEMREKSLIRKSLKETSPEFGSEEFASEFRRNFLSGLTSDMKIFLMRDLTVNGNKIDTNIGFSEDAFFRNKVYSEIAMRDGRLEFIRGKIEKNRVLNAGGWSVVNFPVDFYFSFEKKYLISKVGNRFIVEAAS